MTSTKSMKAFLVTVKSKNGNKFIGMVSDKKPDASDIKLQHTFLYEQELEQIKFGYSGYRKHENIKRELALVQEEYENEVAAINKHDYTIKCLGGVQL